MEPSEIEFLAESLPVTIVPNFTQGSAEDRIYLLGGEVGPFRAGIPVSVPLWAALSLRSRKKCRVRQPDFLEADRLEEALAAERESQFFTPLPSPHLFSAARLVMDAALEDLTGADRARAALKDLWDVRQAKLRRSVDAFVQSGLQHAKLDHLQLIELNSVRPLLPLTLDHVYRMERANAKVAAAAARSQGSQNTTLGNSTF